MTLTKVSKNGKKPERKLRNNKGKTLAEIIRFNAVMNYFTTEDTEDAEFLYF